jgi:hypothetical protein
MTVNFLQTSDTHQRFTYSRLIEPTKQMRLAQIRPSQDKHSAIQLVIKHVNLGHYGEARFLKHQEEWIILSAREPERPPPLTLDSKAENDATTPEFQALSYTWGDIAPVYDVYIESQDDQGCLSVRENLHGFLVNWRHETRASAWLWIDQICINQEDETEKGRQVNLMAEIYVRAAEVIAWLGPAFEGSDEAMDFIGDVARDYTLLRSPAARRESDQGVKHHLQALIGIGKASYWSRLWIVQEVLLGGDRVFLHLGSKILHYTTEVKPAFRRVIDHSLKRLVDGQAYSLSPAWPARYVVAPSWLHVYHLAVKQECYDERDKAFGMLGLINPDCQFHPDYSMTYQDIYFAIIRAEIHAWPDVDITALKWLSIFDKHHDTIDTKAVRQLLRKEAHPLWRKIREERWREHRKRGAPESFGGIKHRCWIAPCEKYISCSPAWLVRIRLRWMFPNKNSWRWRSELLHRTVSDNKDLYYV